MAKEQSIRCVDCDKDLFELDELHGLNFELRAKVRGPIKFDPCIDLCVKCIEHRLDRKLTFSDFTRSLENLYIWPMPRSARLERRMGFA